MRILIILAIGLGIGYLYRKFRVESEKLKVPGLIAEQAEQKKENLEKVMALVREKGEISNDHVEAGLEVSDATATNNLQELEWQGRIEQVGDTGRGVKYRALNG